MKKLEAAISISTENLLSFVGGDVVITSDAERDIKALLKIEEEIKKIREQVEDALLAAMNEKNVMKIERGGVKIIRHVTGHKYAIDKTRPIDSKFIKVVPHQIPNSEAIEAHRTVNGELPEGVIESARKIGVTIKYEE